jgi:hypothetical protein
LVKYGDFCKRRRIDLEGQKSDDAWALDAGCARPVSALALRERERKRKGKGKRERDREREREREKKIAIGIRGR